jgi:DNA-binding response OmpR family regulator
VLALRLGADEAVPGSLAPEAYAAHVDALLRRTGGAPEAEPRGERGVPAVGALELDAARGRAWLGGAPLALSPTELRLLLALASPPEVVHLRAELADLAGGRRSAAPGGRALDVHMARLRAKLRRGPAGSPAIVAARGRGYCLTVPAQ